LDDVIEAIEEREIIIYTEPILIQRHSRGGAKIRFCRCERYKELEGYDNSKLVLTTTKKVDILTKSLQSVQIWNFEKEKNKLLSAIPAIQPVRNENLKHTGLDI
jgi:hypothetical protein